MASFQSATYMPPDEFGAFSGDHYESNPAELEFGDDFGELSWMPRATEETANEYMLSMLSPFVPDLAYADVMDVQAVENPQWWAGRAIAIPEDHHFDEFDFGSFDDEAPVDKALGTLMKYHLLKGVSSFSVIPVAIHMSVVLDIRNSLDSDEEKRHVMMEYIVFFLGLWTGLFLALLTFGVYLLKK